MEAENRDGEGCTILLPTVTAYNQVENTTVWAMLQYGFLLDIKSSSENWVAVTSLNQEKGKISSSHNINIVNLGEMTFLPYLMYKYLGTAY